MKAELYLREIYRLDDNAVVEIVIWRLPRALPG
jgi:hypothetical protein